MSALYGIILKHRSIDFSERQNLWCLLQDILHYIRLKPKDLLPIGAGQAKSDLWAVLWHEKEVKWVVATFLFEFLCDENLHYKYCLENLLLVMLCEPMDLCVSFSFPDSYASSTTTHSIFSLNYHRDLLRLSQAFCSFFLASLPRFL